MNVSNLNILAINIYALLNYKQAFLLYFLGKGQQFFKGGMHCILCPPPPANYGPECNTYRGVTLADFKVYFYDFYLVYFYYLDRIY